MDVKNHAGVIGYSQMKSALGSLKLNPARLRNHQVGDMHVHGGSVTNMQRSLPNKNLNF